MKLILQQVGKRYNHNWIFRRVSLEWTSGKHYAIKGPNGSGKSTLLQIIAGSVLQSEGQYELVNHENRTIEPEKQHEHVSLCAPYLELIEEMTGMELLQFHFSFKKPLKSLDEMLHQIGLDQAADRPIRYYSSGMKQRLKLAQAFFSETGLLLFDEPTTNLDESGITLYKTLLNEQTTNRLVIICSNDPNETTSCSDALFINDYQEK
ncbi:MAG: ATP-binding cassette domain-containing protein [Ferruginibacter sp.]